MFYLSNAFSISMLPGERDVRFQKMHSEPGPGPFWHSIVGHAPTAALFSSLLGITVAVNRESIVLTTEDTLIVGQYTGPRLEEGATTLPEGAEIQWWMVYVVR